MIDHQSQEQHPCLFWDLEAMVMISATWTSKMQLSWKAWVHLQPYADHAGTFRPTQKAVRPGSTVVEEGVPGREEGLETISRRYSLFCKLNHLNHPKPMAGLLFRNLS